MKLQKNFLLRREKERFMAELEKIVRFLDDYLETDKVPDDSWNGLQVEGKSLVNKVLFAVDSGLETFQKAVDAEADLIVVHHGMFWQKDNPAAIGHIKKTDGIFA